MALIIGIAAIRNSAEECLKVLQCRYSRQSYYSHRETNAFAEDAIEPLLKRCFNFKLGANALDVTNIPGYIGLTNLLGSPSDVCITFPSNRLTIKKELTYDGSGYWVSQYIRTPIISEDKKQKNPDRMQTMSG